MAASAASRLRDDHTFSGGEAIGLDHERRRRSFNISTSILRIRKNLRFRRRNQIFSHQFFCENLAAFEPRGLLRRPKDVQTIRLKFIDNTSDQRRFGTNNGEINSSLLRKTPQCSHISNWNIDTGRELRNSRIARRAINFFNNLCV